MFEVYSAGQSGGTKKSEIDYEALNEYVIETAGLQTKEVLIGVVSGLIDLGTQKQEDAAMPFDGDEEAQEAEIAKNPNTYFEMMPDPANSKNQKLFKRWPQKAIQSVTLSVDFPDIMLNKGQFFGDDSGEERPLRMYLGGQFYLPTVGMVVGRPIPLRIKKNTKDKWSFDKKHALYKMASGAKLIDASKDEVFLPESIDKLLGQALSFEVQIYNRENKGKNYYTESIQYVSGLGRNAKAPDYDFEPTIIQFNKANNETSLKELRHHVKNTIKQASNYEGSKIQQELEALYEKNSQDKEEPEDKPEPSAAKPKAAPAAKPKKKVDVPDDLDESAPF